MGIADRDYMRERNRRNFENLIGDGDRPFNPGKQSSLVGPVLFWVLIAFLMYLGFQLYYDKREKERTKRVAAVSVSGQRATPEEVRRRPLDAVRSLPEPESPAPSPIKEMASRQPRATAPVEHQSQRAAPPGTGGTIYLCKAYNGGTFWAQAHCNQHQALIESMVSVPPGMPFEQQVELAQQRRQALAQTTYTSPAPAAAPDPISSNKAECEEIDRRVERLDGMARQPQSAQMQDWIRGERKAARDRQFGLHC